LIDQKIFLGEIEVSLNFPETLKKREAQGKRCLRSGNEAGGDERKGTGRPYLRILPLKYDLKGSQQRVK